MFSLSVFSGHIILWQPFFWLRGLLLRSSIRRERFCLKLILDLFFTFFFDNKNNFIAIFLSALVLKKICFEDRSEQTVNFKKKTTSRIRRFKIQLLYIFYFLIFCLLFAIYFFIIHSQSLISYKVYYMTFRDSWQRKILFDKWVTCRFHSFLYRK